jgi:hypothetical protein
MYIRIVRKVIMYWVSLRNVESTECESLQRYDAKFADNFVMDISVEFVTSIFKVIDE